MLDNGRKRLIAVLLMSVIMVTLGFAGLSAAPQELRLYTLGIGGAGGVGGIIGTGIAKTTERHVPNVRITTESISGGSGERAARVGMGEIDFGIASASATAKRCKKYPTIRAILSTHQSNLHMMVRGDSDVKTYYDLKGAKIAMASPDSANYTFGKIILEAHGLKEKKDWTPVWIGSGEFADAVKEGRVGAASLSSPIPAPAPQQLAASSYGLRLLPCSQDILKKIAEKQPYLVASSIPAGTYSGVDYDVPTTGSPTLLIVNIKNVDDDVIYGMLKAILESGEMAKVHPLGKLLTIERAFKSIPKGIPLHPAAEKYFKEKGMVN